MNEETFSRQELLARSRASRQELDKWMALKLVRTVGYAPNRAPLFSETAMERIRHIQKLSELGYGLEDIQKIMKKVGLPKEKALRKEARTPERFLTVGDLAEQSAVSPRTIKHWEDKGIIEPDMRSEGGFRLYSKVFVFLCQLIRDLQLFGYTLDDIKVISGHYKDYLALRDRPDAFPKPVVTAKLDKMTDGVKKLYDTMELLKQGINRWEVLLKKIRKEILGLKGKNLKRHESRRAHTHA